MLCIDVGVADDDAQSANREIALVGNEMSQQCRRCEVEWNAQKKITASLIQLHGEPIHRLRHRTGTARGTGGGTQAERGSKR